MSSPSGIAPYLKAAAEAEAESLEQHQEFVRVIDELDGLFRGLVTGKSHSVHPVCSFLGMNAHAAFLSAAAAALRGQAPATFMILRGCIESAAYALLVGLDKADGDLWLARREQPQEMKNNFSVNRAVQKLSFDPNLAKMLRDTYQWMIEFGGHPNPRSIVDHIRFRNDESEDHYPVSLAYIQGAESVGLIRSLSATIENGCFAVALLCHAIPDHPDMPATFERIWPLFNGFQKYLADEGYLTQTS
jgi:hypothetical protein